MSSAVQQQETPLSNNDDTAPPPLVTVDAAGGETPVVVTNTGPASAGAVTPAPKPLWTCTCNGGQVWPLWAVESCSDPKAAKKGRCPATVTFIYRNGPDDPPLASVVRKHPSAAVQKLVGSIVPNGLPKRTLKARLHAARAPFTTFSVTGADAIAKAARLVRLLAPELPKPDINGSNPKIRWDPPMRVPMKMGADGNLTMDDRVEALLRDMASTGTVPAPGSLEAVVPASALPPAPKSPPADDGVPSSTPEVSQFAHRYDHVEFLNENDPLAHPPNPQ